MIIIHKKILWESSHNTIKAAMDAAVKDDADLRYADLWYADLRGANLSDANLRNANLSDADLRGVKGLPN